MDKVTFKDKIALAVVLLSFAYFFLSTWMGKRDEQILTALIAADATIFGYYFGSSISSSKKDDTMAALASQKATDTTINAPADSTGVTINQGPAGGPTS